MHETHRNIDEKAVAAAKRFLREEARLLECIQQVDTARVFEALGFPSLFVYCTRRLRFSESLAYAFISVARKAVGVPALKQAVDQGVLNVSQARRIVSVVTPATASDWIAKAATKKQRDIEREVALSLPVTTTRARVRALGGDMAEMKLVVPQALREKIERLTQVRGCSVIDALTFAVESTLERHDPVRKAERNLGKAKKEKAPAEPALRRAHPVAAQTRHAVALRDEGRCTMPLPDGTRCDSRLWLHLHHQQPRSLGGPDTVENLTTLCASHHRMLHGRART